MIFVLLLLCIAITTISAMLAGKADKQHKEGLFAACMFSCILFVFGAVLCICFIVTLGVKVSHLPVMDEKIAMYQEENAYIENQIDMVVKQYQEYETDIFESANVDSPMVLVSLYPELKADTLVQEQIDIYVANNQKIKELKEKKINGNVYRWWLYFGG